MAIFRPKKLWVAGTSIFGVIFGPKSLGSKDLKYPKNTLKMHILHACYQDFLKKGRLAQSNFKGSKNEHKFEPSTPNFLKKGLL